MPPMPGVGGACRRAVGLAAGGLATVWSLWGAGCASPLYSNPDTDLRRAILESSRRELAESRQAPERITLSRTDRVPALELKPEILEQLEATSGPNAYSKLPTSVSLDLLGRPQQAVTVSLERVIITSVRNNLAVQFARIAPAISEAQLAKAETAFDWVLFSNASWTKTDEPTVGSFSPGETERQDISGSVGVRRRMITGGQIALQQQVSVANNTAPGAFSTPNPARAAQLTLQVDQPLLRNFGSDVALAEIRLDTNAHRDSIQDLKAALLKTVADGEDGYWQLVRAVGNLQIAQRLLGMAEKVRDVLKTRRDANVDVKPSQYSDAVATVESRRADVIRAENTLRQTSDRLKQLINDPTFTVGSEVLLLPSDAPIDAALTFSLLEVMATAIANRPEVQRSLLAIDDASIRQTLSDNARLPQLDLRAQVKFNGLTGNGMDAAFRSMTDDNFVGYLVALALEVPIGNRAAEATFRAARLTRMQTVIAYRDVLTRVLLEVKANLRNADDSYRLIAQTRAARLAAAENLRTLEVEERTTGGLTPEFLDLKIRRQQALGDAEVQELTAITDYNIAIARLHASMGTALERNRIKFEAPPMRDALLPASATSIDSAAPVATPRR